MNGMNVRIAAAAALLLASTALLLASTAPLLAAEPAKAKKKYDVSDMAKLGAAMKEIADWSGVDHCSSWMTGDFKGVVLVGTFATDHGCMAEGYFADGYYHEQRSDSAAALAVAGWSDVSKRKALAETWADALGDTAIPTKTTKVLKDGSVTVEGWRTEPVGMVPERVSELLRFTFSPSGTVTEKTVQVKREKL